MRTNFAKVCFQLYYKETSVYVMLPHTLESRILIDVSAATQMERAAAAAVAAAGLKLRLISVQITSGE